VASLLGYEPIAFPVPIERRHLRDEIDRRHGRFDAGDALRDLMGPSRQIEQVVQQIERVADSPLTILIQGETGTGKEFVARAIHRLSARRERRFVAIDCGAIPETLIESELFGHEKGAFTGAEQRREGRFQSTGGGTLFLDEIVNLPLSAQPKLLRALEEREVQPLGARRTASVDARIVAASNVPLEREIDAGRFRPDLYYRLNECSITLPPLRERLEDIGYLANRFLAEARIEFGRPIREISKMAADLLVRHRWPGNVRQLRSVIRRAVLFSGDVILPDHLSVLSLEAIAAPADGDAAGAPPGRTLKEISSAAAAEAERRAIRGALQTAKGNKTVTARVLGLDYKTLRLKMKHLGLAASEFRPS